MKHYVYIYYDQNEEPIYVGKGKRRRFKAHLKEARNPHLRNKIAKMRRNGFEPTVRIVARFETHEEALDAEVWLIAGFRGAGIKLCNLTDGGEGCVPTAEVLANRNLSIKRAHNRPEMRAATSARAKETTNRPEVKAAVSAFHKEYKNRPEVKAATSAFQKEYQNRPEIKAANSDFQKKRWARPEVKATMSARQTIAQNRPEVRSARSARAKEQMNSRAQRVLRMKYGYFGISPNRSKWQARYHKKPLGLFNTPIEAARAYNLVAEHKNRIDDLPIDFPDRRREATVLVSSEKSATTP